MSEPISGLPPAPPPARPRDAAIAIPYRHRADGLEVLWVKRARDLGFAASFHAFPGGRLDAGDATVPMEGAEGPERTLRVTAARELFEEVGLLVSDGPLVPPEALAAFRKALLEGKQTFAQGLNALGLRLHARTFRNAGRWITPPSFPVRFDARTFLVEVKNAGFVPEVDGKELALGAWVTPKAALAEWSQGSALLHPPTLYAFEVLAQFSNAESAAMQLSAPPNVVSWIPTRAEYQKGVRCMPLQTATLPPAAHINTYVVGHGELLIVDPGADDGRECARLFAVLEGLRSEGKRAKAIFLTHHHSDHVGGALRVRDRLKLPVLCHAKTADRLPFRADRLLEDGEVLTLAGTPAMRWRVLLTPGHARGHLCLMDEASRALIAGDMVAGLGTILIDPPEGDLTDYLAQLERLRMLPVGTIYAAHGPPIPDGPAKLEEYRLHREMRERKVIAALVTHKTLRPIALAAYSDLAPELYPLAERSTQAHLIKLIREGRVARTEDRYALA